MVHGKNPICTGEEEIDFEYSSYAGVRKFTAPFEGVLPTLDRRHNETKSQGMRDFYEMYMTNSECPACHGARLKPEILSIKVGEKNINELTAMPINKIKEYLNSLELNKHRGNDFRVDIKRNRPKITILDRRRIRIFNII